MPFNLLPLYYPSPLPSSHWHHKLVLNICKSATFLLFNSLWYVLESIYRWYHTVFICLSLTYFTLEYALQVHTCCKWKSFIHLYDWIVLRVCVSHIFFIHASVDGHLGCFRILAIVNNAIAGVYHLTVSVVMNPAWLIWVPLLRISHKAALRHKHML